MTRLSWPPILARGRSIVDSYDTGVTLRQLFYRLVAEGLLPNTRPYYRRLSSYTAEARRRGTFPDLLDRQSRIEQRASFSDPDDAMEWLRDVYRRDRTEGQPWTILVGVEKAGMSAQLDAWFTDPLGIPHVALGGYASQTLCHQVAAFIARRQRPAVLIYAGDFDPAGEDIDRDFIERVGAFEEVIRVALLPEQVTAYRLVESFDPEVRRKLGKDPRADAFRRRHGELHQYEVDALAPDVLRDLYRTAVDDFWEADAFAAVKVAEAEDIEALGGAAGG
jgi:hypothetical protein